MAILPRATEAHTLFLGWPVKIEALNPMDRWSRSGAQEARRRYQERYHEATYTHTHTHVENQKQSEVWTVRAL